MVKPVLLMTIQEAHKEYNSLTDQIQAKYEQLVSGEFGSPGTPAFDAEARELANLLAHVSLLHYLEPNTHQITNPYCTLLCIGQSDSSSSSHYAATFMQY